MAALPPGTTHVSAIPASVPVGLGTQAGFGAAILAAVLALIDAIAGDNIDSDTKFLIGAAVASTIATVLSRGYQAGKLYAARRGIDL